MWKREVWFTGGYNPKTIFIAKYNAPFCNRSRLPVIQFTVEKDKKHKKIMRPSFEDFKELIQELRSISNGKTVNCEPTTVNGYAL